MDKIGKIFLYDKGGNDMNPNIMMKLMSAWGNFQNAHPKVVSYFNMLSKQKLEEGTVIQITVTRPGGEPLTCNMKVLQSDLDMIEDLKQLAMNPQ